MTATLTTPEAHAFADFFVRRDAAKSPAGSCWRLFLADHDALVLRCQLADVENARMRAALTGAGPSPSQGHQPIPDRPSVAATPASTAPLDGARSARERGAA